MAGGCLRLKKSNFFLKFVFKILKDSILLRKQLKKVVGNIHSFLSLVSILSCQILQILSSLWYSATFLFLLPCAVLPHINWDQPMCKCHVHQYPFRLFHDKGGTLRLEHCTASNPLENNNLQFLRRKDKASETVRNLHEFHLLVQLLAYDLNYLYIYQIICNKRMMQKFSDIVNYLN